jgi:SAM-dependent methyltransferase
MEAGAPFGSTGNFPAHPRIVEMFINAAKIKFDESILDVGHGSGMVLHVADRMGYKFLSGIEYSEVAFALSRNNLSGSIKLIHGDANNLDLTPYSTIFFFSPFRGNLAEIFFNRIPENIKIIITINHDLIIEKILNSKGFNSIYTYQHCIYKNFNGKIWKR